MGRTHFKWEDGHHCSPQQAGPGQQEKLMNSVYIENGTKRCNVDKNNSRYCVSPETHSSL